MLGNMDTERMLAIDSGLQFSRHIYYMNNVNGERQLKFNKTIKNVNVFRGCVGRLRRSHRVSGITLNPTSIVDTAGIPQEQAVLVESSHKHSAHNLI